MSSNSSEEAAQNSNYSLGTACLQIWWNAIWMKWPGESGGKILDNGGIISGHFATINLTVQKYVWNSHGLNSEHFDKAVNNS